MAGGERSDGPGRVWTRLTFVAGALTVLSCSAPAVLHGPATTAAPDAAPGPAPQSLTAAPGSSSAPSPNAIATARAPSPEPPLCSPSSPADLSPTQFTRIHSAPVLSAAVGTPPRAAVWSGSVVTLFDGPSRFDAPIARELPPPRLPAGVTVELFFGRDDQPRLMGFAPADPAASGNAVPVYLRFRNGTFRPEPSELGPLGAPRGALYGVLGFADPEVVCRPRELCLVKRTTGWARVPAHAAPARVVLRDGSVFALHADHIEQLGDRGWAKLEPARTFEHPLDAWLTPSGELWVTDRSAPGLLRLKGGQWEPVTSPIVEPRAVFGHSEGSMFVVGKNGAAEFDGSRFRCVGGVPGPLHLALAVGDDVWLAGESGVYRAPR